MERLLRWANVGLAILTLMAYASPHLSPARWGLISVLAPFYPVFALGHLLFVLWWLLRRRWYALVSVACLLAGWQHLTAYLNATRAQPAADTEMPVQVMSYNCRSFHDMHQGNAVIPPAEMAAFLASYQPDVLCLQEFPTGSKHTAAYIAEISRQTGMAHHYLLSGGCLMLFSRYPIRDRGGHYFDNRSNGYLFADVQVATQSLRIFNLHLQTNAVTHLTEEVAKEGNFREKGTWLNVQGILGRYQRAATMRVQQATEIAEKARNSPVPVVLCGDFNDVPLSRTYHILEGDLQDGFRAGARGLATTFAGSVPALRIDYIFTHPTLRVLDYRVSRAGGSDHYPVLSRLGVTRSGGE